jgi:hypothetical protein
LFINLSDAVEVALAQGAAGALAALQAGLQVGNAGFDQVKVRSSRSGKHFGRGSDRQGRRGPSSQRQQRGGHGGLGTVVQKLATFHTQEGEEQKEQFQM